MKSLGGGLVRYAGMTWIECPERPDAVGQCTAPGTIEILSGGGVVERFDALPGDTILVQEGATIRPETVVIESGALARGVRADLPHGVEAVVRWCEPVSSTMLDEVTGLSHLVFSPGQEDVEVDLVDDDGRTVVRMDVPRHARPIAVDGDRVHRGSLLATVLRPSPCETIRLGGVEALREFLDLRVYRPLGTATTSPLVGRVERIDKTAISLRTADGRLHRIRRRNGDHSLVVREGEEVRAGDSLESGQRSHHRLLRAWGEERLAAHMIEELEIETARRGLPIPRTAWTLVVRSMLAWRRILQPGDTGLRRHQVVSRRVFERLQREISDRGGTPATAAPALRGLRAMALERVRGRQR